MNRIFLAAIFFSVTLTSCHFGSGRRMDGNGIIKSETRSVGTFNSVDVSGNIDVYVKQDSVASVKIEADENLQEYVHITVDGGVLEINEEDGYDLQSAKGIKVYVSGASFKNFEASGACDIYSENKVTGTNEIGINVSGSSSVKMELNAPAIRAELSGASHLDLKGETKKISLNGSGASGITCFELLSEETHVELSGACNADVFASVKLDVDVSGASHVKYKGNATVTQEASGASSVKKVE
jgi:hypothetical protein